MQCQVEKVGGREGGKTEVRTGLRGGCSGKLRWSEVNKEGGRTHEEVPQKRKD